MRVIKCDLCKKNIQGKPVTAGVGLLSGVELCGKCGKPHLPDIVYHFERVSEEEVK